MSAKKEKKQKIKVKAGKLSQKEAITGLLFVTPWFIGTAMFLIYPLATSFWYSLNNILITPKGRVFNFIGRGNYTQILMSDPDFPMELSTYLLSTVISVPVIVVFALIIAMLLNGKIVCKGFFRLIFFLPVIVVSGPVMNMLTEQGAATISTIDASAIESVLEDILPSMLASTIGDLFENMVTMLWYSGVQILIFLSALQKIDRAQYEAAQMDGASGWECFWKITLPTVKPMILLNVIYTIVFISGNEQNSIITLIQDSMFSGGEGKGYGYAAAMAWIYSLVVVIMVILFAVILTARKDVYERQVKKAKKQAKKDARTLKKIRKKGEHNAKKIEKSLSSGNRGADGTREDY